MEEIESVTVKAADLNRNHLGLRIRVSQGDAEFTDMLRGISHQADLIMEPKISLEVPDYLLGRIATILTLTRAGDMQVSGNSDIEVLGAR